MGRISPGSQVYIHVIKLTPKFDQENTFSHDHLVYSMYTSSSTCFGLISAKPFPPLCKFPIFIRPGKIEVELQTNYKTVVLSEKQLKDIKEFHFLLFNDVLEIVKPFLIINNKENKETLFNVPLNADLDYDIDFEIMENNKFLVNKTAEPNEEQKLNLVVNDETYLGTIVTPWYRYEETVSSLIVFFFKLSCTFPLGLYSYRSNQFEC